MKEIVRNNIRSLRIKADLTQEETAKQLEISRGQYILYEKNPMSIKLATLVKMSDIFKCKVNDFIMSNIE